MPGQLKTALPREPIQKPVVSTTIPRTPLALLGCTVHVCCAFVVGSALSRMGSLSSAGAPPKMALAAAPSEHVLRLAGLGGGSPTDLLQDPPDWPPSDADRVSLLHECEAMVKAEIEACDASHDW
jgi:hypothetical protein